MKASSVWRVLVTALVTMEGVNAQAKLEVDPDNRDSILQWIKISAKKIWTYYPGETPGETPGVIP